MLSLSLLLSLLFWYNVFCRWNEKHSDDGTQGLIGEEPENHFHNQTEERSHFLRRDHHSRDIPLNFSRSTLFATANVHTHNIYIQYTTRTHTHTHTLLKREYYSAYSRMISSSSIIIPPYHISRFT